jgi:hypothetical protein
MGNDKKGPCWPTLITTTIAVMSACCIVIGVLLNGWIAPKEERVRKEIALIQKDIENVGNKNKEIENSLSEHKDDNEEVIKKINESIEKYRDESEDRDKETKELMTDIKVAMAGLKAATEYIKETLKEMKHREE